MFGTSTHRRRKRTQAEEMILDVSYSRVEELLEEAIAGLPPVERRALDNFQHALGSQGYREEIEQGILDRLVQDYYTSSGGLARRSLPDDWGEGLPDDWQEGPDLFGEVADYIVGSFIERICFPDPDPPDPPRSNGAHS